MLAAQVDAPAGLLFSLLSDPFSHKNIFSSLEVFLGSISDELRAAGCHPLQCYVYAARMQGASAQLLEQAGPWKKYELDYRARWSFWKASALHVEVEQAGCYASCTGQLIRWCHTWQQVSGACENRLHMETNSQLGTVSVLPEESKTQLQAT